MLSPRLPRPAAQAGSTILGLQGRFKVQIRAASTESAFPGTALRAATIHGPPDELAGCLGAVAELLSKGGGVAAMDSAPRAAAAAAAAGGGGGAAAASGAADGGADGTGGTKVQLPPYPRDSNDVVIIRLLVPERAAGAFASGEGGRVARAVAATAARGASVQLLPADALVSPELVLAAERIVVIAGGRDDVGAAVLAVFRTLAADPGCLAYDNDSVVYVRPASLLTSSAGNVWLFSAKAAPASAPAPAPAPSLAPSLAPALTQGPATTSPSQFAIGGAAASAAAGASGAPYAAGLHPSSARLAGAGPPAARAPAFRYIARGGGGGGISDYWNGSDLSGVPYHYRQIQAQALASAQAQAHAALQWQWQQQQAQQQQAAAAAAAALQQQPPPPPPPPDGGFSGR